MSSVFERHKLLTSLECPSLHLFDLSGRIALVTGGGGKLGAVFSRGLAEAGAVVIVASREVERCRPVAEAIRNSGSKAEAAFLDLRDENSVNKLLEDVLRRHGRLDILVNNAVCRAGSTLESTSVKQWEESMDCNSRGLLLACKIFGQQMIHQNHGCIVNVASIAGVVGPDSRVYRQTSKVSPIDYAFAKGGMIALTIHLATYLSPYNIRVNAISPGGYFSGDQGPEFLEAYCSRVPAGRMAVANDLKGVVVFLASDAAGYITGQNLIVDGGFIAW